MSIDPLALSGEKFPLDSFRLSFALKAAGVGTWDLDLEQQRVWWDDRCKELYGFSKDDVVPYEQVLRYMHPEDRDLVEQAIAWALDSASKGHYDITFRTLGAEDGKLRWLHCKGQAFFNENGQAIRFSGIAQDITTLVETQHKLKSSQTHWRSLVDHSGTATAVYQGREMRIQAVNQAMIKIWGKDESVRGKTFDEALPEVADQPFLGLLQNVYDTGIAYYAPEGPATLGVEGRLQEFWFTYSYVPLKNEFGQVYGIIHTATDITGQIVARQRLQEGEARFKSLIEQSPVAMGLFVGQSLTIELANDLMIQLWGKGASVKGKTLAEALPELQGQRFLEILDQVYTTGVAYTGKAMRTDLVFHGKPQVFYFDFTYQPILDLNGAVYAIMDIAIDVTQDVLLQQKYDQAQQALANAVDLAELGIWDIDLITQTGTFSPRISDWVNLQKPATLRDTFQAIDRSDLLTFMAAFEKAQHIGSAGKLEIEYRLKNQTTGQVRLLQSMGQTLFDEAGTPVAMSGFSRDITQQRATQLALELLVQLRTEELAASNEELRVSSESLFLRKQELQRSNEALKTRTEELAASNEELQASSEEIAESNHRLSESLQELMQTNQQLSFSNERLQRFAYVASHDLQEPLRKIQTFASLLRKKYEQPLGVEGLSYLNRMTKSGEQMSLLIRDLLSYSRLNAQENQFQPVSLQLVLARVLETLELRIQQTHTTLEVEPLPALMGDQSQLTQLFQNLLSNAIKFTKPAQPPRVYITTQILNWNELPAEMNPIVRTEKYHQIVVRDEGIGFDEQYSERIFEVFQRLHDKSEYKGTGVGLAICQRVVENHGGAIIARSESAEGACFEVYLPILR